MLTRAKKRGHNKRIWLLFSSIGLLFLFLTIFCAIFEINISWTHDDEDDGTKSKTKRSKMNISFPYQMLLFFFAWAANNNSNKNKSVLTVFMEISFKDERCMAILKNTIVFLRSIRSMEICVPLVYFGSSLIPPGTFCVQKSLNCI